MSSSSSRLGTFSITSSSHAGSRLLSTTCEWSNIRLSLQKKQLLSMIGNLV
jgi:hypothetical protein